MPNSFRLPRQLFVKASALIFTLANLSQSTDAFEPSLCARAVPNSTREWLEILPNTRSLRRLRADRSSHLSSSLPKTLSPTPPPLRTKLLQNLRLSRRHRLCHLDTRHHFRLLHTPTHADLVFAQLCLGCSLAWIKVPPLPNLPMESNKIDAGDQHIATATTTKLQPFRGPPAVLLSSSGQFRAEAFHDFVAEHAVTPFNLAADSQWLRSSTGLPSRIQPSHQCSTSPSLPESSAFIKTDSTTPITLRLPPPSTQFNEESSWLLPEPLPPRRHRGPMSASSTNDSFISTSLFTLSNSN